MNKKLNLILGLLFICIIVSCQVSKTIYKPLERQWMLISFQNFPKEFLVEKRAQVDLSKKNEDKLFWAFMGCNSFSFSAKSMNKESISFSNINETLFNCSLLNYKNAHLQSEKELETAFKKWFPKMTEYKIEGHFLTLSDGKGNEMKFVAADWD